MSTTVGKPTAKGTTLVLKAAAFAAWKHRDQRRKDAEASPYINHPLALVEVLSSEGKVALVSMPSFHVDSGGE
jgi:guanosine-3',5'-bis(diphosphate) 3'-pyrophosphohydrolase